MSNFKVQNKSKAQMVKFNLEQNFFGIHPFDRRIESLLHYQIDIM
jgi:hypothetical protein